MVEILFHSDNPVSRIFFFLALARKGLTVDLLRYLEPTWSHTDCERYLAEVRNLSVVKTRPGRKELFLHDALYELFDTYFPPEIPLLSWYKRLSDYYRARQSRANQDRVAWGQATVNLLYYELQCDPQLAFETGYVRWSELAIKGHEAGLDMQLRDELLRFMDLQSKRHNATQKLNRAIVDQDSAARWVKRFLARARHRQAIAVAETILALAPAPYPAFVPKPIARLADLSTEQQLEARALFDQANPLFWGYLLTYYGEALVYTGATEAQARRLLEQAIALISEVTLNRDAPLVWLRERLLGRAYNTQGYLLRTYGHYARALESYRRALPHFEAAIILDEQANTLNNLAFLLALLGDTAQATDYADRASNLCQVSEQRYPLALSHNTRGLIYALQGQVEWGRRECQLALSIFQELESSRGIGLACNALGFILRWQGETWKVGQCQPQQALALFQQAANFLDQASQIFSDQVSEPLRLWEAHNEQGSLYGDWGCLLRQQGNESVAQQQYSKAVQHHLQALEIAHRYGLHFQQADTCDDLAEVLADQGKIEDARYWLEQGLALVPKKYTLAASKGFRNAPKPGQAYWLILGKAHLQQGIWALRPLEQDSLTTHIRMEYIHEGIEHFTLAAAYLQRYWPGTTTLNNRLHSMADYLSRVGISTDEAKAQISRVASYYGVDLSVFLDIIGTARR